MLTAERRKLILDLLQKNGRIVAPDLSAELGVSEDTIRRDLREMAADGLLQRVHGGALPLSPALVSYSVREKNITPAKIAIAEKAASLIQDGMVLILGGGTTNVQVAQRIDPNLHVTIITHNLPAAAEFSEKSNANVIVIGGRLYKHSNVTVGSQAIETMRLYRADLCLLGVCSVHPELGICNQDDEESFFQRAMIASSAEVAALVSAEKLNTAAPYIVGSIQELNYIITDSSVPAETLEPYRRQGVEILFA